MPDEGQRPTRIPDSATPVYRVARPKAGIIPVSARVFEATEYADERSGLRGRLLRIKDSVIGNTMSNARLSHERLSKKVALAVFSSDALSSTAYATQEILIILVLAGSGAIKWSLPIALAITALLAIVVLSYRQTVRAYPSGGGAYIVAHENLGVLPGLIAAASLLIDYVLTVAVSIAASVEAIVAAAPEVEPYAVPLASAMVGLIALGNLRGLRESGVVFAIPTYGFIFILGATLAVGLTRVFAGSDPNVFAVGETEHVMTGTEALGLFLILRAFASGCTALTGVEAISNGVQAFKPPEARNAAATLAAMGTVLGVLFLGTTLMARHYGIIYDEESHLTVMAQIGEIAFGGRNAAFYALQVFTAGILFLAANTAFADFPRLAAILARDGYLPRIFHQRGNRLVFSYGIGALTAASIGFLAGFGAQTTRLIPLYALGVFLSFTLSQFGMVLKGRRDKGKNWVRTAAINGFGALVTGVVLVIILVTKFASGAWMVVVAIPLFTLMLWRIGGFYAHLRESSRLAPEERFEFRPEGESKTPIMVPVDALNRPLVETLAYACQRSSDVTAVHVRFDPEESDALIEQWPQRFPSIPLVVIHSPYRLVAEPFSWYVMDRLKEFPAATVLVPKVTVRHWWQRPLANQSLRRLRQLLKRRKLVTVEERAWVIAK